MSLKMIESSKLLRHASVSMTGQQQSTNHVISSCPLTKLKGDNEAYDDDAVIEEHGEHGTCEIK